MLDPYTNESSWILKSAVRILEGLPWVRRRGSISSSPSDDDDARRFLGPLCEEFLVFCDPDRIGRQGDGSRTAAGVRVRPVDGELVAKAEGWNPTAWREVAELVAEATNWIAPLIPIAGDPSPFAGSPATG